MLYSPWSDKYENIHQSRYTEQVKAIIALKSQQIKSEAITYSKVICTILLFINCDQCLKNLNSTCNATINN